MKICVVSSLIGALALVSLGYRALVSLVIGTLATSVLLSQVSRDGQRGSSH